MKVYYRKERDPERICYLLSYVRSHIDFKFEEKILQEDLELENSKENFFLFSVFSWEDFLKLSDLIKKFREKYKSIAINIVIGGPFLSFLDSNDVFKYYPEITHVCLNKGEKFLLKLLEENLPPGQYNGNDFGSIEPYMLEEKYLLKINKILLTFDDIRCGWAKCDFCNLFNQGECNRDRISPETLSNIVAEYLKMDSGGRPHHFIFFDNDIDWKKVQSFFLFLNEKTKLDPKTSYCIFASRVGGKYRLFEEVIKELKFCPIQRIDSFGVELYHPEALKLYNKSTTDPKEIDETLFFFLNLNMCVSAQMLAGLPLIRDKHIIAMLRFENKFLQWQSEKSANERGQIILNQNFFRLDDSIKMFYEPEKWGIELQNQYLLSDMRGCSHLEPIKTKFWRFKMWDEDSKKWLTRHEVYYEKYKYYIRYAEADYFENK